MKVRLKTVVGVDDAEFTFKNSDAAMAYVIDVATSIEVTTDVSLLPPTVIMSLCAMFDECCIAWSGLTDETNMEIPFAPETRDELPTMMKIQAVVAYWQRLQELEEKKGNVSEPDTSSTPTG